MASQSYQRVMAALSLCEGCAISGQHSNGQKSSPSKSLTCIIKEIEEATHEAYKYWSPGLTKREANKINECMRQGDLVAPEIDGTQEEHTPFYTSLALGLLDELFLHTRNSCKLKHLDRVERAIWNLHNYFDRNLDRLAIYEQASQAVTVCLQCLNG